MRILFALVAILLAAPAWALDISLDTVLLVAKRNLRDRLYAETVLITKPVGRDRHVGFIVNKPTKLTLGRLFPSHAPSQKIVDPVYLGGPSSSSVIFAMVEAKRAPEGRLLRLAPDLWLAYESKEVDRIIESPPPHARFFAGMVIWQPGELAQEIRRGLWHVLEAQPGLVLRKSTDRLWQDLVERAERRENTI
ncbi:MAG TPA: YqgE/AlgH family protein [Burkholderiales bacterium]